MIGSTHVYKVQWIDPDCLRAKYGLSDTRNGFHGLFFLFFIFIMKSLLIYSWCLIGSDSPESVSKEFAQIFEVSFNFIFLPLS